MSHQTRIFIDFWNFQLSLNDATPEGYRVDWKAISPWLMEQAATAVGQDLSFEGTSVYISYNPRSEGDRKLRDFSLNVLDRFPGISVTLVERKPRNPPVCPHCHEQIQNCPHCGEKLARTIEKGVDTAIVTDMFRLAWEESLDIAILVSSDRDFVPTVKSFSAKGYKVVNAHFPPQGMHLARACWASIDLKTGIADLERKLQP
ncbi:MAG: NYN domain-containing protein [Anaerolineales bacterium]